jgi:hypothetical protein
MWTSRLTISGLMAVILLTAIGLGTLSRPTELAAAFLFSAAIVILTVSILGALYAQGTSRTFWSGFTIGGWMYLLLHFGPFCDTSIGPYTFPTAVLDVLNESFTPPSPPPRPLPAIEVAAGTAVGAFANPPAVAASGAWDAWTEVDRGRLWGGTRAPSSFFRIGHSLLCLVAGLAAGLLARWWAQRGRAES